MVETGRHKGLKIPRHRTVQVQILFGAPVSLPGQQTKGYLNPNKKIIGVVLHESLTVVSAQEGRDEDVSLITGVR